LIVAMPGATIELFPPPQLMMTTATTTIAKTDKK